MAVFGHGSGLVTELLTLAVLMAHFGHYKTNFDGVPSELALNGCSREACRLHDICIFQAEPLSQPLRNGKNSTANYNR